MKSPAVRVGPADAEALRQWLRGEGLLRSDLRVAHRDGDVVFPVTGVPPHLPATARGSEEEFAPSATRAAGGYRELAGLPEAEAARLPRAFDVVGDVVLVRIPTELAPRAEAIGEALLRFVPSARLVAWDQGVHGTDRVRRLVRIAGGGEFRTRHRENGLEIEVDPSRAYFSPRLAREHALVAGAVRPGERFSDLCCGVGPFSMHVARDGRAASIVAVDGNPEATSLLEQNLRRMGLRDRVEVRTSRLEEFLPGSGVSDRVVLNLPHEGIKYITSVGATVARGGTLHYFEVTRRAERDSRGTELVKMLEPNGVWSVAEHHVVHPYAPDADVVAWTLVRSRAP
ncbi:MAG: methyltransferase [Thermoplasmata archaeon]|nr:methyltransferase [Thermoplasmata archaeon]